MHTTKGLLLIPTLLLFHHATTAQDHWQHLDPDVDEIVGVSATRAKELLKGRTPDTIVVAVIDNGGQYSHPDLDAVTWVNPGEIADNGLDDDKNGYVDDIHGWNFLGNSAGENLKDENLEVTREFARLYPVFKGVDDPSQVVDSLKADYQVFLRAEGEYQREVKELHQMKSNLERMLMLHDMATEWARSRFGEDFTMEDLKKAEAKDDREKALVDFLTALDRDGITKEVISKDLEYASERLAKRYNTELDNRERKVGDDWNDINDSLYGNPQVEARGPYHGTAVASLIAAEQNGEGVDGIATNVKIMYIRAVPNGDERDKDVALAIRYAVRNGARIINCSFGKYYSPHYEWVQDAMELARQHGVLIVHGAGNDARDLDMTDFYPNGYLADGSEADNWLNVGAMGMVDDKDMVASFSNYGAEEVHIFAPGVDLETCALNQEYSTGSGTSFASPVVAGVAAVLLGYYPELSPTQLKEILMASVHKPKTKKVVVPGTGGKKAKFSKLSQSGGVVNLYNALLLAEELRTKGEL